MELKYDSRIYLSSTYLVDLRSRNKLEFLKISILLALAIYTISEKYLAKP